MPIRTYVSSAWQDIKDLKSTVNGASKTSEDARIYVNGAWESVWSSSLNVFFGWTYSTTGTVQYYAYNIKDEGDYIFYQISSDKKTSARSDLVLEVKPLATDSTYNISFTVENVSSTASVGCYGIAVGYLDSSGKITTIKNFSDIKDGDYETSIDASLDVAYITFVFQCYGYDKTHYGYLKNLKINGISCKFIE